ncbi:Replication protein A 70 kDa DNA-binding subunit A [Arachis hypogaea]|nr:Replication protein A 70 kDa DNA-binding subunit A [Arachis hypogaea]
MVDLMFERRGGVVDVIIPGYEEDFKCKIIPPREAWRIKVRVLRAWTVPSFGNADVPNSMELILVDENSTKIQATIRKQLIHKFKDHLLEGSCYKMSYFAVVSNQGSYRATKHEFKLIFLFRTTVTTIPDDIIPKSCFSIYPFEDILQMSQDHDYLVDVIGLLTLVGEEKNYDRDGKTVKMVVVKLSSQKMMLRCALFGEYVDQLNDFLASGYVEQPVVIVQLAKIKLFRGQPGLQNVMKATKIYFNPDLSEVIDFRKSMVEQGINGTQPLFIANEGKSVSLEDDFMRLTRRSTIDQLHDNKDDGSFVIMGTITDIVEEGCWWYSTCVCGKAVYLESGVYFCDVCMHHVTNVIPRFRLKVAVSDHTGQGIFVLFDRETTYLLKKACADLFNEVQKEPTVLCGDSYPITFKTLEGKKVLLKVDTKSLGIDKYFGTFRVKRICDDPTISSMFELAENENEVTPVKDAHVPGIGLDIGEPSYTQPTSKDVKLSVLDKDESVPGLNDISIDMDANRKSVVPQVSGDNDENQVFSDEVGSLLNSGVEETQDFLSHLLDNSDNNDVSFICNDVVRSKVKRNLESDFQKALEETVGPSSKMIKIEDNLDG